MYKVMIIREMVCSERNVKTLEDVEACVNAFKNGSYKDLFIFKITKSYKFNFLLLINHIKGVE